MRTALAAIGLIVIAASALPLLRKDDWWIRWFDFPRLQILAIGVLVFLAYLPLAGDSAFAYAILALLAVALGHQCYMMFPYTALARTQVESSRRATRESTVRLLFANVLMDNRDSAKLKAMIAELDPDVVLAVEADEWWRAELGSLRETRPHALEHPRDNTYGMLLYSRLELAHPQVKFLVQDDVPSIHARLRLRSGDEAELRCLHPRPPAPGEAKTSKPRERELLFVGEELQARDSPALVLGDLNDVAWSRTSYRFQRVSGLLDPRIGRGFYNTFHARYPFLRYPLDHCFHSRHFRLAGFRRLDAFGSDHFPVCITLSYEPEAAAQRA